MFSNSTTRTRLFTSESVTKGHPDKIADQISDGILDSLIKHDPRARVACETLVTTGLVVLAGEVTVHNPAAERALLMVEDTAREIIRSIGYDDPAIGFDYRSCAVIKLLHRQSPDISQGVTASRKKKKEQGAGDQGLMFGFACDETRQLMPLPIHLAHRLTIRLSEASESGQVRWLRPDGKSQVTVEYVGSEPHRVHTVVLATQHDESVVNPRTGNMSDRARRTLIAKIIKPVILEECPKLWNDRIKFHINPTGRFVVGGPHGDTGLTGRKIIVDTYGGRGAHGGGSFSGKDPSKVDRSASYMARHIAKNVVAAKLAQVCEVQVSYAIGLAEPVSVLVNCEGTAVVDERRLARVVREIFPLKPAEIIRYLDLLRPIYRETAHDGHFGRVGANFTWERTDKVRALRKACRV
ncbi:MAG: methionine adenosyltransferase [Phycisphaerae bacterium]|nr:methionine adenosyltransferase [Phycisphaerae bacterium]